MTITRIVLLRAVADPRTEVYAAIPRVRGTWDTAEAWLREPGGMAWKVTGRIRPSVEAGLVTLAPVGARYHERRPYMLTPAGKKALTELASKEA